MGRFMADEADNYGGTGGTGFFSLKNDKDVAKIRIMYRDASDVCGYAVHEVQVNDKKRYVNCIRNYNEPASKCPFCANGKKQVAKLFIPVFDIESGSVKIWERGKNFFGQISSICGRYGSKGDLVSHIFEVERNGKKGDTNTTYAFYEVEQTDTTLEDLPEVTEILGGFILDKSAEEMEYFLDNEEFPSDSDNFDRATEERPRRRESEEAPTRRTPATGRGRGDRY